MEKIFTFAQKIDIILKIKGLSIKDIEKELGVDGTIYKAYNKNRYPRKKLVEEIQRKFHVKPSWWKNPVGTSEEDVFDKNPTSVTDDRPLNKKDPVEENRILIRNLDRIGEVNEFLLVELKRYKERFGNI